MKARFADGVLFGIALTVGAAAAAARVQRRRRTDRGEGLSSECPGCGGRFRYRHPSQKKMAFYLHMIENGCYLEQVA